MVKIHSNQNAEIWYTGKAWHINNKFNIKNVKKCLLNQLKNVREVKELAWDRGGWLHQTSLRAVYSMMMMKNVVHSYSYDLRNFYGIWFLFRSQLFCRRRRHPRKSFVPNLAPFSHLCFWSDILYTQLICRDYIFEGLAFIVSRFDQKYSICYFSWVEVVGKFVLL